MQLNNAKFNVVFTFTLVLKLARISSCDWHNTSVNVKFANDRNTIFDFGPETFLQISNNNTKVYL
jgi:hypothetical protein